MERTKSKLPKLKNSNEIQLQPLPLPLPSPSPSPPWIELPRDLTANILKRLNVECIMESALKVCTTWAEVCVDPAMWRVVSMRFAKHFGDRYCSEEVIRKRRESQNAYHMLCRRVVAWSQGQLVDLTLEYFGTKELINYIADEASNLKRLTLRGCLEIAIYLNDAVKQFPELEELHLTNMPFVLPPDVKTIGLTCPKLKSFSYNGRGYMYHRQIRLDGNDDESHPHEYALAIGTSMPNLRHLRLFAQPIQNQSLEAILDACPHLESLDLRQCFNLDLRGNLGKRCCKQIKDLRLPSDSARDIFHLVGGPSDWDYDNSGRQRLVGRPSDWDYDNSGTQQLVGRPSDWDDNNTDRDDDDSDGNSSDETLGDYDDDDGGDYNYCDSDDCDTPNSSAREYIGDAAFYFGNDDF